MAARRRVRGNIEKLPSGSYRAIVYAGVDPLTGREHRLRETCPTMADAKIALTRLQRQVDEQKHPKSGITVREAIQQWLDVAELGVTTREQYDDLIRLYIGPTLGNMQAEKGCRAAGALLLAANAVQAPVLRSAPEGPRLPAAWAQPRPEDPLRPPGRVRAGGAVALSGE
jgi:hypothetical protein